jgi:adenylate kinase family enzyme
MPSFLGNGFVLARLYCRNVPMLSAGDRLPCRPSRVLVGGTSGSGKTTLAGRIAVMIGASHTEIDSLHHGPGWTVRPEFIADVSALAQAQQWVTEYQYPDARPILQARADLMVYLLLPRWLVMSRVVHRTIRRSIRGEVLWNGNVEPPLWSFFTDRDHIVRYAWRNHSRNASRIADFQAARPDLPIVVLTSGSEIAQWLRGPLAIAIANRGTR